MHKFKKFALAAFAAVSILGASAPAFAGYWVYGPNGWYCQQTCGWVYGYYVCG